MLGAVQAGDPWHGTDTGGMEGTGVKGLEDSLFTFSATPSSPPVKKSVFLLRKLKKVLTSWGTGRGRREREQ